MAKPILLTKPSIFSRHRTLWIASAFSILIIFSALWSFSNPQPSFSSLLNKANTTYHCSQDCQNLIETSHDAIINQTSYDDSEVGYTIDKPMIKWDEKRREWLEHNPAFALRNGVLVITGSQPSPCTNPSGDHLLLRFFKNKVDYCRIHGYQIFYNNAFLHPKMRSVWAKLPVLRAAMVAHPEVEWLLWVDSDAVFTDMEFKIPLERYKDHNFVVHGWRDLIYKKKSWVSINSGVFLLRNCQWSMDFLDAWASMGPKSPDYANWGKIVKSTLKDMLFPKVDDQAALVYLLLKGEKKWRDMTYVENQYYLHSYWLIIVDKYDDIANKYVEIEKRVPRLRRQHAEAVTESYAAEWERYLTEDGRRRPFVTHFTGCQPCSGEANPEFEGGSCRVGMERALNFADNQVLRNYGFVHPDIGINGSHVSPLPFHYDGDESDQLVR